MLPCLIFLGWRHADIIFVFGILVEAVVFLISAFDWGSKKSTYEWEKVFPQLNNDNDNELVISQGIAEGTQQQQIQKIMDTIVTLNSSVTELNSATKKLTNSVETMEKNYESVTESTKKYQIEIDNLRVKISHANQKLKEFDSFNYQKNS